MTAEPSDPGTEAQEGFVVALTPRQLAVAGLISALVVFWRRRRRGPG